MLQQVTAPDGVQLACEVSGSGPPLVMVHGAGSARWAFGLLVPHLESRFTTVVFDRRGRGDSGDGEVYEVEREFDDVVAVLDAFGPRPCLFGHSYGAMVAAAAAPRANGLAGLVLYEPPMGGVLVDDGWLERFESLIAADERDRATGDYLRDVGGYSDTEIAAMRITPVWEARLAIAPVLVRELRAEQTYTLPLVDLARLDVPTLLLVGTESPDWARRSTDAYAEAIPRATVVTLEGQGHGATATAPELVADRLALLRA